MCCVAAAYISGFGMIGIACVLQDVVVGVKIAGAILVDGLDGVMAGANRAPGRPRSALHRAALDAPGIAVTTNEGNLTCVRCC